MVTSWGVERRARLSSKLPISRAFGLLSGYFGPPAEQESDVRILAPCGYNARPLIGVWATPPYLHNGAVRTVYDLLSDTRPEKFVYGSHEYDPINLGYTQDLGPGTVLLTPRSPAIGTQAIGGPTKHRDPAGSARSFPKRINTPS
jgi:hypothetical protein